jgi:prepilin-type processing-associated H-X9-DG protein
MIPLNSEQKQLLFDYCIGLTSQEHTAEAEALVSANEQAAEIHSKMKATLAPFNSLEPEPCPDDLAERTVLRLNNLAHSSQDRLQQLLAGEQTRAVAVKSWRRLGLSRRLATAAVLMIAGSILFTTLNYLRHNSWRQQCKTQQDSIFGGFNNYVLDHDGRRPAVAAAAGAPWWKLGYQGSENHSNTRNVYQLVKDGYVKPGCFVCPSCSKGRKAPQLTPSEIRTYRDFPDRSYITYSFQIICSKAGNARLLDRKVVMADMSPLFEELPRDFKQPLKLALTKRLLTWNSINHKRRGQNALFADGHVEFLRGRYIGISGDDIFTLQDTDVYRGDEVPSCETDFFLAP